jgi:DNA-binding response OmpR family regulator
MFIENGGRQSQSEATSSAQLGSILVVDTYPGSWDWSLALTAKGLIIVAVSKAVDAVAKVVAGPFDVALIEANLEGPIDGVALARRLKSLAPRLRVVLLAGGLESHRVRLLGGMLFMSKPGSTRELEEMLKTLGVLS